MKFNDEKLNIRKATIEDIDILIKLRIDYLLVDKGHLTADEETAIRSQLTTYFEKHTGHNFTAVFTETDNKVVSTAFLVITEKPAKVLRQIIDEAKQLDVSYIDLSATEDGKPLYKKLGFSETISKYTEMRLQLI